MIHAAPRTVCTRSDLRFSKRARKGEKGKLAVPVEADEWEEAASGSSGEKPCDAHKEARGFDRHERYCKINSNRERALRNYRRCGGAGSEVDPNVSNPASLLNLFQTLQTAQTHNFTLQDNDFDMDNIDMDLSQEDPDFGPMDVIRSLSPIQHDVPADNPQLPAVYIISKPHPNDHLAVVEVLSLSHPLRQQGDPTDRKRLDNLIDAARPYTPWCTMSDFEYTETAVQGLLKPKFIDTQLRGMTGPWARGHGDITMKDYCDYRRVLTQARVSGIQFRKATVQASLWGVEKKYTFFYRDPWEWIRGLVTDPSLAHVTAWKSRHMFYCEDGGRERFITEPWTADHWYEVGMLFNCNRMELLIPNPYLNCWLLLHIWLDKGLVTKHVKIFPIIFRPLWLPSEIRNASGNGGGVFLGLMVMVKDPGNPKDRTDKENYKFAQFRREIYQQVLEIIFSSLYERSWRGEVVTCRDDVPRVLYPGFLIESLDFEEAWNFTCCQSGRANERLKLAPRQVCVLSFAVLKNASSATQKEKILMNYGLHDIVHFMWNFRFSDPYQAVSYDLLHFDESGKWGHHLWPLILAPVGSPQSGLPNANLDPRDIVKSARARNPYKHILDVVDHSAA
ncbi:hypothetical protein B0H14DRAFT_2572077 [Mycena olivaceomarginata]|nr:hypothetical protein B0H14DRAFT_2572077 [Mycena olivaceomarginata]